MAKHIAVYNRVKLYDIVFKRSVTSEIDFFEAVYQQHTGKKLTSLLEIACGPAYHGIAAAQRGMRVVGLDLLEEMIRFAKEQAQKEQVEMQFITADMSNFSLDQPVDMAICIFDAIDVLHDDVVIINHLQCVAQSLVEGGLYMIQITHPRLSNYSNYGTFYYHGERNGIEVDLHWATNNPTFDPITAIAEVDIELHVTENSKTSIIHDSAAERLITPTEWALFARLSGVFEPIAWYGNFDINQLLDNSDNSDYAIIVLKHL